ncbi:sensor histidine kinase [Flavipsychrobacter stenotrophus]|uniref:histidine kinase n=2 Tax=Flavipsychrobacter stenotrophus TaxID=2077091 RepID=A0A2S7SW24_9BACT|nr:sensor histidine kinase [Flavipsychrobacter stenotrophus]
MAQFDDLYTLLYLFCMKRIFPLIVVLISLSVIGILFIQMSWINNAIALKHDEFERGVESAMVKVRESLYSKYLMKSGENFFNEESKENKLRNEFAVLGNFTNEELKESIDKALEQNNIKYKYEYGVTNIFRNIIYQSDGFHVSDMHKDHMIELAPKDAIRGRETLFLNIKENKNQVIGEMWWMIVASIVFTCIIILAFALTVRTLLNQKNISEIKSDFINNMTHELKTPLATISLAIDALTNEKVIHDTDKIKLYSGMIKEENKRMNKQVEKILQAARLEKEELKLNLQELDVRQVINKVTDNLALQIQEKNGALNLKLNATNNKIEADDVHFSNIIFNLLDNAMKYSTKAPYIEVETLNTSTGALAIKIKDNGIGMDKETQSRIFERFFRAHTGNLHNVKGFGLGLSYVKAIVDAHDGKIRVESAPGKGSTFTITFPVKES